MSDTNRHTVRIAVYVLLLREGQVLLLRRAHTKWRNGEYTLPAGHVEEAESARTAAAREASEEVGAVIDPSKLQFAHVMRQQDKGDDYIDFYFVTHSWEGEPTNCEPDKCDELRWAPLDDLPDKVIPSVRQALVSYTQAVGYSEYE